MVKGKPKQNDGLKTAPTARMLREGAGKMHLSANAVASAIDAATEFAHKMAKATFERTKTQRLKVSTAKGLTYNPLRAALESTCSHISAKEVCIKSSAAGTHGSKNIKGHRVVRNNGTALTTARRVFLSKDAGGNGYEDRSVSEEMEVQIANLIDVYLMHLGRKAAMLADVAKAKTLSSKHIDVAAQLMH